MSLTKEKFSCLKGEINYLVQNERRTLTPWRKYFLKSLNVIKEWKSMEMWMNGMMQETKSFMMGQVANELSNYAVFEGKKILLAFLLKYQHDERPPRGSFFPAEVEAVKEIVKIVKEYEGICYEDGQILPGARCKRDYAGVVVELRANDVKFRKWTGMSQSQFNILLEDIEQDLEDIEMGATALPGDFKLLLTLKHLVLGHSVRKIHRDYLPLDYSTTADLLYNTLRIIVEQSADYMSSTDTAQEQLNAMYLKHRLPNCKGFIGCKHVMIKEPRYRPEEYLNYRNSHSVLLRLTCDAHGNFIHATIGQEIQLEDDEEEIAQLKGEFPLHWVGDGSYEATERIITPYRRINLTEQEQNYNMQLTLGLNVLERSLAAIVNRFRAMQGKVNAYPTEGGLREGHADLIIKATIVLHNFINHTADRDTPRVSTAMPPNSAIFDQAPNTKTSSASRDAQELRDSLRDYFWDTKPLL
ncbi:putative nuclease HARBI1 [Lutzomyia longipalpis]|uniref:putative nuclease HARBI1 n=1 Tax=Lutzomyia longipalpis TaxID=7200 RepID=UPI002483C98A|nr:putative nuclease HARBI1 [Lutzomyia longipalpis]